MRIVKLRENPLYTSDNGEKKAIGADTCFVMGDMSIARGRPAIWKSCRKTIQGVQFADSSVGTRRHGESQESYCSICRQEGKFEIRNTFHRGRLAYSVKALTGAAVAERR